MRTERSRATLTVSVVIVGVVAWALLGRWAGQAPAGLPAGAVESREATTALPAPPALSPGPAVSPSDAPVATLPGDAVITPPPVDFDVAPASPAPPPAQLRAATAPAAMGKAEGTWAVVVGIDDYPGSGHDLRSAANDAADVDAALASYGVPVGQRLNLRDGQASADRIRAAIDWLVGHAGPEATAVVFYAGHVRKERGSEVVVAADGRVIADTELARRLAGLEARQLWIGIAACYGGGFDELLAPGRVLTAAADADHLAYENEGFGRSYLVQYMVRQAMLEGAAPGNVQESFAYARTAIERDYPGRAPVVLDRTTGPVRLGTPPPAPAEPPPPARSSTGDGGGGDGGGGDGTGAPGAAESNACTRMTFGVVSCS